MKLLGYKNEPVTALCVKWRACTSWKQNHKWVKLKS